MKRILIVILMFLPFYSFANPLPPPIEYVIDEHNTNYFYAEFYRDTRHDYQFDINLETIMYRGEVVEGDIINIVKFELSDKNTERGYSDNLIIFDKCALGGIEYFYISDLDCKQFENESYSRECRNYSYLTFERHILQDGCNESLYEPVVLTEEDIEEMKTETQYHDTNPDPYEEEEKSDEDVDSGKIDMDSDGDFDSDDENSDVEEEVVDETVADDENKSSSGCSLSF